MNNKKNMEEENPRWYEQFKNKCNNCGKFLAMELVKETNNYYYWQCRYCGFKRRHLVSFAIYKHKDNKTFRELPLG